LFSLFHETPFDWFIIELEPDLYQDKTDIWLILADKW